MSLGNWPHQMQSIYKWFTNLAVFRPSVVTWMRKHVDSSNMIYSAAPTFSLIQIWIENDCGGKWKPLGLQVSGSLPDAGQPGPGFHLLPHHRLNLQLLHEHWQPGHSGSTCQSCEEQEKPLNSKKRCKEKGTIPEKEIPSPSVNACQASWRLHWCDPGRPGCPACDSKLWKSKHGSGWRTLFRSSGGRGQ